MALTLLGLGLVAAYDGDYDGAAARLEDSLDRYRALDNRWGIAFALSSLGRVAAARGDRGRAGEALGEAAAMQRALGDKSSAAYSLHTLAMIALGTGEGSEATRLLRESLDLARDAGNQSIVAYCLEGLGSAAVAGGSPERGARLWGAAEALRDVVGAPSTPTERSLYEPFLAAMRAQLDPAALAAAWSDGKAMTQERVLEYALGERAE